MTYYEFELHDVDDHEKLKGLKGEELWKWCRENGYEHVNTNYAFRHLVFGLVSDMCHFIYEGLQCSRKGKLSVAFSDFRKPLQDNLFYLEWILADWDDFLVRFRSGPEHLDLNKQIKDVTARESQRKQIIQKAEEASEGICGLGSDWHYEVRYNKDSDIGLDPIFNQAIHLVTTHKHYRTLEENINFIFCTFDDHNSLWSRLYSALPCILLHALRVVRALFLRIDAEFYPHHKNENLRLSAGILLWLNHLESTEQDQVLANATEIYLNENLPACSKCDKPIEASIKNLVRLWKRGMIRCGSCKRNSILSGRNE